MIPAQPPQKHKAGAPKLNKNRQTHGHNGRKILLSAAGFENINRSSAGGQQLHTRKLELLDHCGGAGRVSVVTRRLIERVCITEYLVDHLDLYLAQLGPRIIDKRKRILIPVVQERDSMVSALVRMYDSIGYKPVEKAKSTLPEYLALRAAERDAKSQPTDKSHQHVTARPEPAETVTVPSPEQPAPAPVPPESEIEFQKEPDEAGAPESWRSRLARKPL